MNAPRRLATAASMARMMNTLWARVHALLGTRNDPQPCSVRTVLLSASDRSALGSAVASAHPWHGRDPVVQGPAVAHAAGREGDWRLGNDRGDRREGDRAGAAHGGAAGGPAWRRACERDRVPPRLSTHVSQGHGSARQQQARRVEHHGVGTLDDSKRRPPTPCRVRRASARGGRPTPQRRGERAALPPVPLRA
jgi:hypothetical protein